MTLRIAIAGASGRMGRMLIEGVLAAPDLQLAGALDIAGSPATQKRALAAGSIISPTAMSVPRV